VTFIDARIVTYPYPPTSRCDPPKEDPTGEPLCRPLPISMFPLTRRAPLPPGRQSPRRRHRTALHQFSFIVGSLARLEIKGNEAHARGRPKESAGPSVVGAWAKGIAELGNAQDVPSSSAFGVRSPVRSSTFPQPASRTSGKYL